MAIFTHGSDLTLAPTIGPLIPAGAGTVRGALDLLTRQGFSAVQLDASLSGLRPRELDTRARRDLLALLGRQGVRLAGLDLFIPRKHFLDVQHVDRAMAATLSAIDLAVDLGRVPLSVALPVEQLAGDLRAALVEAADGRGIRLAVHAEDQLDALTTWVQEVDRPALGMGLDPAALLAASIDPSQTIQRLSKHLAVARLSDMTRAGNLRCPVGDGELDVLPYRISVDLAVSRTGPVVLELRGLENPAASAVAAKRVWDV